MVSPKCSYDPQTHPSFAHHYHMDLLVLLSLPGPSDRASLQRSLENIIFLFQAWPEWEIGPERFCLSLLSVSSLCSLGTHHTVWAGEMAQWGDLCLTDPLTLFMAPWTPLGMISEHRAGDSPGYNWSVSQHSPIIIIYYIYYSMLYIYYNYNSL